MSEVQAVDPSLIRKHCAKCGYELGAVQYHGKSVIPVCSPLGPQRGSIVAGHKWHNSKEEEHLHYVCLRCGYDWCEPPADAQTPPELDLTGDEEEESEE